MVLAAAAVITANDVTAQGPTLRADRSGLSVGWGDGRQGDGRPVRVVSVEFIDPGKGATSGRLGKLKVGNDSFTIEFPDKSGVRARSHRDGNEAGLSVRLGRTSMKRLVTGALAAVLLLSGVPASFAQT